MKQVDFYLISNGVPNARYKLASRLANKLQRLEQSALLVTDSPEQTSELDKTMWQFSDTSFLPHDDIADLDSAISNIHIGAHLEVSPAVLAKNYNVLINLSLDVPLFSHHFERIAEIVEADDQSKSSARSRYKHYQAEGFELKTHNIEL